MSCEGIEHIPANTAFLGGMLALLQGSSPWWVFSATIAGTALGCALVTILAPWLSGLVRLSTLTSYIHGFGLFLSVGVILSYIRFGWIGALSWVLGRVLGVLVIWMWEWWYARQNASKLGMALTSSETNFLLAFLIYAKQLGLEQNVYVSVEEADTGEWKRCLMEYASTRPRAMQRFES